MNAEVKRSWQDTLKSFIDKRNITMLFLGFSAGMPLLLIFSSLSLWLREAGVERSAVTYFSWAALGFSFKFVWAPLVDKLPIPFLTERMGRRRSYLFVSQFLIITAIVWMGMVDPQQGNGLTYMALAAVLLGFSAATQDIAIDAFRIESAEAEMQAILSATYIAGYRLAMIVSGAGSLYLASYLGSTAEAYSYEAWRYTYLVMALFMLIGVATTLMRPEPEHAASSLKHPTKDYFNFFLSFLIIVACFVACFVYSADIVSQLKSSLTELFGNKHLAGLIVGTLRLALAVAVAIGVAVVVGKTELVNTDMLTEGYIDPVKNFFDRYGKNVAILLLCLVGFYRISDIVLGVISNVFYQDMGYSKIQIANAVKTVGVFMSILGGFLGGLLTARFGVTRMLMWGALAASATNLLFLLLASVEPNTPLFYIVVSTDNLAAGFASAAFVAFLSALTDVKFTAVQYAIFSSLMTLLPKVIGGYSGGIVDFIGYPGFFIFTTIIGLPVLYLVHLSGKNFKLEQKK